MSDESPCSSEPLKLRQQPREFHLANVPSSTPTNELTDTAALFRAANVPRSDQQRLSPPVAENDVHALLRANVAAATAAGLNEVRPVVRRPSRRKRDYWLVLIGFDLLIVTLVLLVGPNVVSVLFGFGGIVFVDLALTWIMWVLLDDY